MQRLNGKNKAQFFSVDITVAILVFISILIASSLYWDYSTEKIKLAEKRGNIQLAAKNVLSNLIETEGNPSNWHNISENDFNTTTVDSIGLAKSYSYNNSNINNRALGLTKYGAWVLDKDKIYALYNRTSKYEDVKKILGISHYEYELKISVWNGVFYFLQYSAGNTPHNATNIVRVDRYALLNDEWVKVNLLVWDDE